MITIITTNKKKEQIMTIKNIIAALAIIAMPTFTFAQEKSNQQLSTEYKYKISALKSEIKALKSKIKLEPGNATFVTDMNMKKAELKTAQNEKKVIDKAIKTERAQRKAAEKAQKAADKAAKAANNLNALKTSKGM